MKLVITVVHDRDKNKITEALLRNGFKFTKIGSTGGFLREGNVTLLIGVEGNEVERLVIMVAESCIEPRDLSLPNGTSSIPASNLHEARAQFEREFILSKLHENDWNITQTAKQLGLERSYLYRKMKMYGMEKGV